MYLYVEQKSYWIIAFSLFLISHLNDSTLQHKYDVSTNDFYEWNLVHFQMTFTNEI